LGKLPFEKIIYCNDNPKYYIEKISMDKLLGINRPDNVANWMECFFNLHKNYMYDRYNDKSSFEKFLLHSSDDLPIVVKKEGNFYIDGEGKHRLTFAKCLGIEKVLVIYYCMGTTPLNCKCISLLKRDWKATLYRI